METKLYVGNLSYDTTAEDLNTLFAQAGKPDQIADPGAGLIQGSLKIQTPLGRHRSKLAAKRDEVAR